MARKRPEVNDLDRPRDTRGSMPIENRSVTPPNAEEMSAIIAGLPKNLDPSAEQIERLLKRLVKSGKLRPEAVGGAKAFTVEAIDKIEGRTEPTNPAQAAKVVDSRYLIEGYREPETAQEVETEKISRESGFKESTRSIDPGPDLMERSPIRKLIAAGLRGNKKAIKARLRRQEREGVKVFAADKDEDKKRRPPTIGERTAQIMREPAPESVADEETPGGPYKGKGSRGVPKIADTGGLQRRPRSEERRRQAMQVLRRMKDRPDVFVDRKTGKLVEQGKPEAMDPERTRKQKFIGPMEAEDVPTRFEDVGEPVQGPLRKLPRGPRTAAGKPIEYAFEDSGRPMGMSAKKFEEIRAVEGVPFDLTMYRKLDRLARKGDMGAARVLAKLKTKGFGLKKSFEGGEVKNPTKPESKPKFKTARQKARSKAKGESIEMGRTASEEARRVIAGPRQKDNSGTRRSANAMRTAERNFRSRAAERVGESGEIAGPLTEAQLELIRKAALKMTASEPRAMVVERPVGTSYPEEVVAPRGIKPEPAPRRLPKVGRAGGKKVSAPLPAAKKATSRFEVGGAPRPRYRVMTS
jgi:hypothetical protein